MEKPRQIVHNAHQELWFRPSPALPFAVLSELFERKGIIATPRLGERDFSHPKGYVLNTMATARLFDERWNECLREDVLITRVVSKPLRDFTDSEIKDTVYSSVEAVREDLAYFNKDGPVTLDDTVSLVEFSRINHGE
jgi:hypothetical protein